MMHAVILYSSIAMLFLMLLSMIRLISGPSVLDRILSSNVIGTQATVLLLLIGILYGNLSMFVDIALAYALLNFISTIAATKYWSRSKTVNLSQEE